MDYVLDKNIWTHADYDIMGWHDATIYGMIFENNGESTSNLVFDIDYIFQWVNPVQPDNHYTFQVAPCTLVFKNVIHLRMEIDTDLILPLSFEIADLLLVSKEQIDANSYVYEWDMMLQEGFIRFKSEGFRQYVRTNPVHIASQSLEMSQRGGICFDKQAFIE